MGKFAENSTFEEVYGAYLFYFGNPSNNFINLNKADGHLYQGTNKDEKVITKRLIFAK